MRVTNEYLIPYAGLKIGKHEFEYLISKTFFDYFEYDEFDSADIKVKLVLEKQSNMLELNFKHKGTVNVLCDVRGEPFDFPIKGKLKLIVRFGETYNDENEELLILPFGEHQIDIAQYIYEMIVLSIPLKRISPQALEEESFEETEIAEEQDIKEEEIDPRWAALKKLLTDK
ncbi:MULTISPECIES: YceD family protein [Flavobacterium]|uniref:DUF177 domain-containing protein n=2 Tax=Flavobacterium TaxID=237 RepID=A0AA94F168_9FLAO|nr:MULTISPECIES: DUF177 domain-containing protein [Flavobacterium]OXA82652.1 DNA-binding protein [Flavobacterium columnare] [Flavobacterium columnare NBRC 100251 = ATCC 23463]AMA48036.1 DNA-binding protein [Flavobacterium covae]MCH4829937.1 DUF177 domain-containing protein [Flavobacterium columnare]MCH4832683.1 DUF177 domain-containing protein [Flavobacterium columnare]MCJ1807200.1 DUF177 domain-containing protein [Flavobacterium covae]